MYNINRRKFLGYFGAVALIDTTVMHHSSNYRQKTTELNSRSKNKWQAAATLKILEENLN